MLGAYGLPPLFAHLVELATFLAVAVIALGVGLRLLAILGVARTLSLGERLVFGFALGFGALSFVMLAMGLLGVLYLPVGLGVLALFALLGARFLRIAYSNASPLAAIKRNIIGLGHDPINLFLSLVILLVVGAALANALVPVATQDDLMYHLALPQRYIETHSIQFYPDSTYSLFPQAMEMLYTWGLLLGSDRLAVLFAFGMGLLGPAAAAMFARRWLAGGKQGIWRTLPLLVAAIFLTTPLVGYILRAANTDLAQASFDLLTVYALWLFFAYKPPQQWRFVQSADSAEDGAQGMWYAIRERKPKGNYGLLILAGLCAGLAFSTKYYGIFIGAMMGPLWLMIDMKGKKPREALPEWGKRIAAFGVPFACVVGVWLVRNLIAAGNPVWPLAGVFFKGAYWSPDAPPAALLGSIPTPGLATIPTAIADLWYAWTRGPLLIDGQTHAVDLGPILLLALATLFFVRWRVQPALMLIGLAAFWYLAVWALFFSHTSARYLSTFFLFAALLGAYGLVALATRWPVTRWVIGALVGLALAVLAVQAAWSAEPYLQTVLALDRQAEEAYLSQYMEDYPVMVYIREHTPPDAVIYVWDGQPRGYYISRKYVYARLVPLYSGFGQSLEIWRARLRELGITHVLVHDRDRLAPGQPPGQDPFAQAARAFQTAYFGLEEAHAGTYTLYALKP